VAVTVLFQMCLLAVPTFGETPTRSRDGVRHLVSTFEVQSLAGHNYTDLFCVGDQKAADIRKSMRVPIGKMLMLL
jgi:hypothetical protein